MGPTSPLRTVIHTLNGIQAGLAVVGIGVNSVIIHSGNGTLENVLGVVTPINTLGNLIISYASRALGKKFNMEKKHVMLMQGLLMTAFNTAVIVGAVALGVLNPAGAAIAGVSAAFFIGLNLLNTYALYKKPYDDYQEINSDDYQEIHPSFEIV